MSFLDEDHERGVGEDIFDSYDEVTIDSDDDEQMSRVDPPNVNPSGTIQIIHDPLEGDQDETNAPTVTDYDFTDNIQNAPFTFGAANPPLFGKHYFKSGEKKWIQTMPDGKHFDYPKFQLNNSRELCYKFNKGLCGNYQHCSWNNTKEMCYFTINKDLIVDFINKVSEELIQNDFKSKEILREGEYFISDIVNYNVFTERPDEKIIMSSNTNLNKILSVVFGKDNIPRIGKRRYKLQSLQDYNQLNINNPLKDMTNWFVQPIIENNNTIFRAFANSYYWLLHPLNDKLIRNLKYYSVLQTSLSNKYKATVVEWLFDRQNQKEIEDNLLPYIKYGKINEFIIKLNVSIHTNTNCLIELYVLSKLNNIQIYVYNENYNVIYVFHPTQGFIYDHNKTQSSFDKSQFKSKRTIYLRFLYITKNIFPDRIECLYPK